MSHPEDGPPEPTEEQEEAHYQQAAVSRSTVTVTGIDVEAVSGIISGIVENKLSGDESYLSALQRAIEAKVAQVSEVEIGELVRAEVQRQVDRGFRHYDAYTGYAVKAVFAGELEKELEKAKVAMRAQVDAVFRAKFGEALKAAMGGLL